MEKRKSFVFFADWHTVLEKYDAALRCRVYDAIIRYAVGGDEPELEGEAGMAFAFIREDIDRNNRKYEEVCARRREYARKGGKAKAEKYSGKNAADASEGDSVPKATLRHHKLPNAALNDNENGNDNGNGNENGSLLNERKDNNIPPHSRAHACARGTKKDFFSELKKDASFAGAAAAALETTEGRVQEMLVKFEKECGAKRKAHDSADDLRSHFIDWARLELRRPRRKKQPTRQDNGKDTKTGGASSAGGSGTRPGGAEGAGGAAADSFGLADG